MPFRFGQASVNKSEAIKLFARRIRVAKWKLIVCLMLLLSVLTPMFVVADHFQFGAGTPVAIVSSTLATALGIPAMPLSAMVHTYVLNDPSLHEPHVVVDAVSGAVAWLALAALIAIAEWMSGSKLPPMNDRRR